MSPLTPVEKRIVRAVALKCAVETLKGCGDRSSDITISLAKEFEPYLSGGD